MLWLYRPGPLDLQLGCTSPMFPKISLTRLGQKCYRTLLEFQATPCGVPTPGLKSSILKNSNIPVCCLQSFVFFFFVFFSSGSILPCCHSCNRQKKTPTWIPSRMRERATWTRMFPGKLQRFQTVRSTRRVARRWRKTATWAGPGLWERTASLHSGWSRSSNSGARGRGDQEALVFKTELISVTSVTSVPNSGICWCH